MKYIYGDVIYPISKDEIYYGENMFIGIKDGKVDRLTSSRPKEDPIIDYSNHIILPSFYDLHLHAPQFPNMGLGYELQLLDWLNEYTFHEESKYKDLNYARSVYMKFINELWENGILYSSIFATIHKESSLLLAQLMEEANLRGYVGKVNMDRNSPEYLCENTDQSLKDTEYFIKAMEKFKNIRPIITPRFVPSTTKKLMEGLGEIADKYNVPVQSHLSENQDEIKWVHELHPDSSFYGEVYDEFGLFGDQKTVMAHCIYSTEEEIDLMKKKNVYIAHCPTSNFNVSSGLCPAKKYLDLNLNIGVGSDISGGHTLNMFEVMRNIMSASNIRYAYGQSDQLSLENLLYITFYNSGKFFESPGTFKKNSLFNALIINDEKLGKSNRNLKERLVRLIYCGNSSLVKHRYLKGEIIPKPYDQVL